MSMDEKHPNINYISADLCHNFSDLLGSPYLKNCDICQRLYYDSVGIQNPKNQVKSIV